MMTCIIIVIIFKKFIMCLAHSVHLTSAYWMNDLKKKFKNEIESLWPE